MPSTPTTRPASPRCASTSASSPRTASSGRPDGKSADPIDRRDDDLLKIVPENPRQAFDMHKVILSLVDDRRFFPIKPRFARNLITGLARIDGYPLGIVANNSMYMRRRSST